MRIVGRKDSLFVAGAIAVVAGLLFPPSADILDVLLIFSVSLTAAVLIVTFSAQTALQVLGFPLLIVLATMLRVALSIASAKLILSQGSAGAVINFFGTALVGNNVMLAALVFGTLAIIIFGTICKAAENISHTAAEVTADIAPIKQNSVNSDLCAGIINNTQSLELQGKIAREAGFFAAMAGAARFMLCAAVIELVIVFVNIAASTALGIEASTTMGISIKTYATLAVGAGAIVQTSALLAAVASAYLVRKSSISAAANNRFAEKESVERIKVVSTDHTGVTASQEAKLQFANVPSCTEATQSPRIGSELVETTNSATSVNIKAEKKVIAKDLEWFDEQSSGRKNYTQSEWNDYYEAIAESIESRPANVAKTILMAAETVEELPVTIPVNVAMRLAQRGRKCLLIDLDSERAAVSKVFDIDGGGPSSTSEPEAIATCISNLWVWPASNFGKDNPTNTKQVIANLQSRYDHLVIYAPNIRLWADKNKIAGCVRAAMLFEAQKKVFEDLVSEGESGNSCLGEFRKLLTSYGCAILEPSEVIAEVL